MLDCLLEQSLIYKKKEGEKEGRKRNQGDMIYLYPSLVGHWELTIAIVD